MTKVTALTGILMVSIVCLTFAQDKLQGAYTIRLNISQLKNKPQKIYLNRNCSESENAIIQEVPVSGNLATFKGKINEPAAMYITTQPENGRLSFYLEPADVKIDCGSSLDECVLSGSPLQKEFERINAEEKSNERKRTLVSIEKSKAASLQDTAKVKGTWLEYQQVKDELSNFYKSYCIAQAESSPLSIYALDKYFRNERGFELYIPLPVSKLNSSDSLYHLLPLKYRKLASAKALKAQIDKAKTIAIGSSAPDFTEPDTSGKPIRLSSLRGKYVLLDFWGSWCGDCRRQFPDLIKVYDEFKGKNFEMLAVSWDWIGSKSNSKEKWQKAIREDHTPWLQVSDLQYKNAAVVLYSIEVVPMNFLIDPKGMIIGLDLSPDELKQKLSELL